MKVIEVTKLEKIYNESDVDVHAIRGIDLSFEAGEFAAIVGPSGSGKTTLLNIIGGLDQPTKGEVIIEGQDVTRMKRGELIEFRLNHIGFVFQAYNLIPVLTAFENAELVLALKGVDKKERRAKVMDLLAEVGLNGLEGRRPAELSGGQQQRVAIARAIASDPAVVLADEPTANVDSETAGKLLTIMEKLNSERGVTFIFSTHDPRVMKRAGRNIRLVDGRVESDEKS